MYPLRWNQDDAPRLHYCSLAPFLSQISNCSNLPFGTQGTSWRTESVSYKKRGTRKGLCAQEPHRVLLGFSPGVPVNAKPVPRAM